MASRQSCTLRLTRWTILSPRHTVSWLYGKKCTLNVTCWAIPFVGIPFAVSKTKCTLKPRRNPIAYGRYTVFCLHDQNCTLSFTRWTISWPRCTVLCLYGQRCTRNPISNPMAWVHDNFIIVKPTDTMVDIGYFPGRPARPLRPKYGTSYNGWSKCTTAVPLS